MPNNNDFVIKNGVLTEYTGEGEEKVTIPNSVKEIGASAFSDCISLEYIVIPNSVTTIGSSAFDDCSRLINITIPNSVTKIGANVLAGCNNLKNVTAPAKFKDTLIKELGNKVEFIDSNEKK